ncbi:hypothetical protein [Pseudoalteromonas phenolica]|uniref:hypothetical protein n=1 Tax=Pseudoalteromonas phenolica TaxID=161398 RepID=UPI00384DCFA9
MFIIFKWLKTVIIIMLLSQHGFAFAKPMNCEEHHKKASNSELAQTNENIQHQKVEKLHHQKTENSKHNHNLKPQNSEHEHVNKECEKCDASQCICCEGGFCASFYLKVFLNEIKEISTLDIELEPILQRFPPPKSGMHLLPYRPPIIG